MSISIDTSEYDYLRHDFSLFPLYVRVEWKNISFDRTYPSRYGVRFLEDNKKHVDDLLEDLHAEDNALSGKKWETCYPLVGVATVPLTHKMLECLRPSALAVDYHLSCGHGKLY